MVQLPLLAALTMVAFAANSVLTRIALADGAMDPAGFTVLRLFSGTLVLLLLVARAQEWKAAKSGSSWASAAALFVYAAGFSFAYISLDTGTGALILFACVQTTMIGVAIWRKNHPSFAEWAGLMVAFGGLIILLAPGVSAPSPWGAALMAAAGLSWGIYTLRGGDAENALAATAGNFARTLPACAMLLLVMATSIQTTPFGLVLAITSGAVASGLGYALWYQVLETLPTTRAAIVQLTVPALAALGGLIFLGEEPSLRLIIACPLILGGVALAVLSKARHV